MTRFEPSPDARFTYFHVLWLAGVLSCAFVTWFLARNLTVFWRLALTLASAAVGLVIVGGLVMLIVTAVVIPHTPRDSPWSREVDGYMASMLGLAWTNAGREAAAKNPDE